MDSVLREFQAAAGQPGERSIVAFFSSTAREVSQERKDWGNGAFTKALVEGLRGKAAAVGSEKITLTGLNFYVAERVRELGLVEQRIELAAVSFRHLLPQLGDGGRGGCRSR